ncbi:MAG: hypothetical protein QOF78_4637 [Phycisphaerales bacterium]|jgi:uncharacterized protein YndB with AHSA1/START domain|nr:hypothetical protein [Phycisphaerales bacterium]
MLMKILIGVAVILVIFAIVVATRPGGFRIVRSAVISAPPPAVFEQVNDFHKWAAWSPWEHKDPAMKRTFEGPAAGTGANYKWVGNREVGEGGMTITESRPSDLIRIRLDFLKPFASTNTAEFTFKPQGDQTAVTWTMTGSNDNFICKAFCLFMNMDKMVGGDFEKGLAAMKSVVESSPRN